MFILHHHPKRETHTNSLVGVTRGVKTPTVGAPSRGPTCLVMIFHLFPDGHLSFTDSTLHSDLVWEP